MMTGPRLFRTLCRCLAVALVLPAAPLRAAGADDLRDVVGARGRDGEPLLEQRGYVLVDAGQSGQAAFTYWWNSAQQACIRVTTREGRYEQIVNTDASDCGQTRKASGASTGAKVAVGAAALLGIAALAHKSHHREDRSYNEQQTADFERGYRDGLYNHAFSDYSNSRDYVSGYDKGSEERRNQSSYRNDRFDRGGYQSHSPVSDLRGRELSVVWREMGRRGFQQAAEAGVSADSGYTFFWNDRTQQCVSVFVRQGRAEGLSETDRPACKR